MRFEPVPLTGQDFFPLIGEDGAELIAEVCQCVPGTPIPLPTPPPCCPRPFWVATRTFTAYCIDGAGAPVTVTAQAISSVSLEHAACMALANATSQAVAALQCIEGAVH